MLTTPVLAVTDPLQVPNNKVGVHVLDPDEVGDAGRLVNSNGGQWGYVTVVLRSNELNREKWLKFFENCNQLHIIPIVRLATYPDGGVWVKPDAADLVDFANFLTDMPWPVTNRYIILFNEVNHAAEWGGQVDPLQYATLLLDAQRIFKSRSADFFLLSAGLDMSAPQNENSWDALTFYKQISTLQPKWYEAIDGLAVHSYPNPAFSSSPTATSRYGIASFDYEVKLLTSLGYPPKPIFITETGWPHDQPFFTTAFNQVWSDKQIVAVTPFVLFAGSGDFAQFSLLNSNHAPKSTYQEIANLPKTSGSPLLATSLQVTSTVAYRSDQGITSAPAALWQNLVTWWFKLTGQTLFAVGNTVFKVDIADSDATRAQGLSGHGPLADDAGMLFVFQRPDRHQFWMKDMNFGLDFVWLRGGKVVEVTENVPPPADTGGQPVIVNPAQKIDQVLEIKAGSVAKYGIKVGMIGERRWQMWPITK